MLVLPSELTHAHAQANASLRMLLQGLKANRDELLVVDASALTTFDSSALAVLLGCRRAAMLEGKRFEVKSLPAGLQKLAGLYGVGELLPAA
ncbi:STAS domain-containing protein [Acidovorax sp. NCPPB 3576]|uniref:STAS domain-containing protein n=1 Tax=Acidovorax sp. NCPPB 3576 TaxID=2940488 RepID=UPI00234C0128|nr:STAS domain-containing protein [Acidovorax sp. NCPPB 3576]WCM89391.1 STAS domain-containing protein [Acidovorax sp. NCPPB 3576]